MTRTLIMIIAAALAALGIGAVVLAREFDYRRANGPARAGRARDARGRMVKLLDPLPLYLLGRHQEIDAEALAPIAEALEPGVAKRRAALLVPLLAGAAVLILVGVMVAIEGRPAWSDVVSTITNPAILVVLFGGTVMPWVMARRERLLRVRQVMLAHRRCPHCGYGLRGVPPDPEDGITVCPECAAAWQLDDQSIGVVPPRVGARRWVKLILLLVLGASALAGTIVYVMVR